MAEVWIIGTITAGVLGLATTTASLMVLWPPVDDEERRVTLGSLLLLFGCWAWPLLVLLALFLVIREGIRLLKEEG